MTTTYRTPEWLGEIEVRLVGGCTEGCEDTVEVAPLDAPEGFTMKLNWKDITRIQVKPPLPAEPTEQGWYLATFVDGFQEPLERRNDGWYVWRTHQLHGRWDNVWGESWVESVVRLIPEPEPVELPWYGTHNGVPA